MKTDTEQGPMDLLVMPKYRLLKKGERIMRGDECLDDDCERWWPVSTIVLRCDYHPEGFVPHRRPLRHNAEVSGLSTRPPGYRADFD